MTEDKKPKVVLVRLTAGVALDFSAVLADAIEHIDPTLMAKAQTANKEGGNIAAEVGGEVIKALLKHSRVSAFAFLASSAGMTAAQLREEPLSTITNIIGQIKADPELADFLEQARGMLG